MAELPEEFVRLMERVRTGNEDAAREVFERYGPRVRMVVRYHLEQRLRRRYDSDDCAQSVWASFFHCPRERYTFRTPEELVNFLATLARNKVLDRARENNQAQRRAVGQETALDENAADGDHLVDLLAGPGPTPSQVMVARESWEQMLEGQPEHYRKALDMMRLGHSHDEIAAVLGVSTKMLQRILQHVRRKLNRP
jgi:RNA polymerase sigma-70 factor (ECF subfamily)